MAWLKVVLGFLFAVIVFSLLALYWFAPFNSVEFTPAPVNSNFSLNQSLSSQMQFYSNLRYPSSNIPYNIDTGLCSLKKQDDIKRAFEIIENLTILNFYPSLNPELYISCDSRVVVNENYFVAGEGGPVNITETDDFNVIVQGKILLLRDSNCPAPNIAIHELLHALGFNHSTNQNNIMYPITNCDQTIGQDIPSLINNLYSIPSAPDLSFKNATAAIRGRYLDTNLSISNNGLVDSEPAALIISTDGSVVENEIIPPLKIGEGITFIFKNIWVPSINVNELEYQINTNFTEISKANNEIRLEIKKT